MRAGSSAQQAFERATQRIGQAAALESEFDKIGEIKKARERVKQAMFALAGIPNHYVPTLMNTSSPNIEPRWATYSKAVAFLSPALFIWGLSAVFMVPKLQQICAEVGLWNRDQTVWDLTRHNIGMMFLVKDHGVIIFGAIIFVFTLLEWRFKKWAPYRRATVGFVVFLLNLVVLISFFIMILTATVAAASLLHHGK